MPNPALTSADFEYQLPPELIAQRPVEPRDSSRLLVLDPETQTWQDARFNQLPDFLQPGDVLVRNNTKVMPARIIGQKTTGGKVEVLLNRRVHSNPKTEDWECLTKPGLKPSQQIVFGSDSGTKPQFQLKAECIQINNYKRIIRFNKKGQDLMIMLDQLGQTPLPPYIAWNQDDEPVLRQLYQTTYAKLIGSAAAPTAGLHFTSELDDRLAKAGIDTVEVTLHVGLGTFLPVTADQVATKQLHQEWYQVSEEAAARINLAKTAGQRIIAVGTTSTRTLESAVSPETGQVQPGSGSTQLFIMPPHRFHVVDGLITNFHLPKSSLLMLVSALVSQPNTSQPFTDFDSSSVGQAYHHAIHNQYRFYSFGDAMLILSSSR